MKLIGTCADCLFSEVDDVDEIFCYCLEMQNENGSLPLLKSTFGCIYWSKKIVKSKRPTLDTPPLQTIVANLAARVEALEKRVEGQEKVIVEVAVQIKDLKNYVRASLRAG